MPGDCVEHVEQSSAQAQRGLQRTWGARQELGVPAESTELHWILAERPISRFCCFF